MNTAETTRVRYFLDLLIDKRKPVMLVGGAGSGKSVIISEKLNSLSENYAVTNVPFNFYTTSGTASLFVYSLYRVALLLLFASSCEPGTTELRLIGSLCPVPLAHYKVL